MGRYDIGTNLIPTSTVYRIMTVEAEQMCTEGLYRSSVLNLDVVDGNINKWVFFFKVVYCSSVVQTRGIRFKL